MLHALCHDPVQAEGGGGDWDAEDEGGAQEVVPAVSFVFEDGGVNTRKTNKDSSGGATNEKRDGQLS